MQSFTGASTSLAHSAQGADELLRENTSLRARLSLSDEQRVTQEVLRDQLQHFFHRVAEEEKASESVLKDTSSHDEENPLAGTSSTVDGLDASVTAARRTSSMTHAVSTVLHQMQLGKQQAEEALARLQSDTVAPLHAQVEALQAENTALQARIGDLEMSMASTPAPPLVAELRQLRASEALLRQQLQEVQASAAGTVGTFQKSIEEGLAAAGQVPELVGKMEALREELRASHNLQAAQRVLLEELERRHAVEKEIEEAYRTDEANLLKERIAHLETQLQAAAAREAAAVAERDSKDAQLVTAQNEIKALVQQHSEEQVALAQKRQRAEQDASSNPSSIRGEMTKFWYEGRDRIRDLERQVRTLSETQAALRVSQGRVAQLEQRRAVLADNLASLATEVDRRREEERQLRAHCAGLEAERDRLLASVATTVGSVMSESELRSCCTAIRVAATHEAAMSATVVADPHAVEEALRRSQKLKSEVAQLQRQKDQLQRFLQLREDRVRALMEQEAFFLSQRQQQQQQQSASTASGGATGSSSFSLMQFLEYIRQSANDVFLQNETTAARVVTQPGGNWTKKSLIKGPARAAEGPAPAADGAALSDSAAATHRNSFVALQQQFQQSQERLLASHRELLETRSENRRLQAELTTHESEHAAALASQAETSRAVEAANAALTSRTTTLTNELQELRQHYTSAVDMVRAALEGLYNTLQLYHQSEQHAEKLREMVQAERRDMSDLLRREAASWGAAEGSHASAQEAQHAAAAEKIASALQQMEGYIAEAIRETSLQSSQEETAYIGQLVRAIQQQEERVKAAKAAFEASAQAQASSLVERISAAQQQWEATWKAKYQAIEAERTQSVMQQHASVVLQRALEQAVAPPSAPAAAAADAVTTLPGEVEASAAHMPGALQAIRNFITHARQRQEQQQQQQQQAQAAAAAAAAAALSSPPTVAAPSAPTLAAAPPTTSPLTPDSAAPSAASAEPLVPTKVEPAAAPSSEETARAEPASVAAGPTDSGAAEADEEQEAQPSPPQPVSPEVKEEPNQASDATPSSPALNNEEDASAEPSEPQ